MKCPVDGSTLLMGERHGVEIDYCPDCRGVWLDRGELDSIIERSRADSPPAGRNAHESDNHDHDSDDLGYHDGHDRDDEDRHRDQPGSRRKGRFSMLADLIGGGED